MSRYGRVVIDQASTPPRPGPVDAGGCGGGCSDFCDFDFDC
jgi:hypothetical protein